MHILLWVGMFFIGGGILCALGAVHMRHGKTVRAVIAEVISVREPEEIVSEAKKRRFVLMRKKEKQKDITPEEEENAGKLTEEDTEEVKETLRETVFAFVLDGEKKKVTAHISEKATVGEKGQMYYDTKTGLIYSRRIFLTLWLACGAFCVSGVLTILLERIMEM